MLINTFEVHIELIMTNDVFALYHFGQVAGRSKDNVCHKILLVRSLALFTTAGKAGLDTPRYIFLEGLNL